MKILVRENPYLGIFYVVTATTDLAIKWLKSLYKNKVFFIEKARCLT